MSLHVGDTAPALSGTVNADLTGATATAHIRKPDGTVLPAKTATVGTISPTSSAWSCTWAAGDLDVDGVWEVEVQVTYSDTSIQTFGPESFYVHPQIA